MEIFAILVFFGIVGLILVSSILMLVTRRDLGHLRREVDSLRGRLATFEKPLDGPRAEPAESGPAPRPVAARPPSPVPPPAAIPVAPGGGMRHRVPVPDLEKIIGGQWLTWLGVVAIFLGTAFFLAIDLGDSPLAGPLQILIAATVALAFLGVGRLLLGRVQRFLGLGLLGGGIALLFLAAYGMFGFHRLVPVEIVLPLLLAVAVIGAVAALREDSLTIAVLTLVGALLTPLVLTRATGEGTALLSYLIAVGLGAVLGGRRKGWAGLPLGGFLGTCILVSAWWDQGFVQDRLAGVLGPLTVLWVLYGMVPWVGRMQPGFWGMARTAVAAANGAAFSGAVHASLGGALSGWRGGALFLVAIVYLASALWGGRTRRDDPALVANFYTGAALGILAIPVQFDSFTISLAWALLGILFLVMGWRLDDPHHRIAALVGLAFASGRILVTGSCAPPDAPLFLHLAFGGDAGVVALLVAADRIGHRLQATAPAWEKPWLRRILPLAAVLGWWVLTSEVARWTGMDFEHEPSLVSVPLAWALYGAALFEIGCRRGIGWLQGLALVDLALALLLSVGSHAVMAFVQAQGWRSFLNGGFIAGGVTALALVRTHRFCAGTGRDAPPWAPVLAVPLVLGILALVLAMFSLEIAAWFRVREVSFGRNSAWGALVAISIFWTLYGGGTIWAGFLTGKKALRLAGMALLAAVILKVFLVDMRALSPGFRIISFVGVGILLLAISLLYQRERRAKGES
ncbi:MAG: DUF2339 domain-containing protein [Candidatus Krumholzibacteriia bacterium]